MYGLLWRLNEKLKLEPQAIAAAERFEERTGLVATSILVPDVMANGSTVADLQVAGTWPAGENAGVIMVGVENHTRSQEAHYQN